MKKTGLIVLLGLSTAATAAVDFDGMGRVRSMSKANYDFNEDGDDNNKMTNYRFQLGARASQSEDTSVYFQARFNKTAGDTQSGTTQTSGALNDADGMDVHQAYIDHNFNDNFSMRAGRQELAYGDHLFIGTVGWSDVGRAFDGYKFSYKSKFGKTDLLMMTIKENGVESDANRDYSLSGIYHSGTFGSVKNVDFYYLVDADETTKTADTDTTITSTGVRVKSDVKALDYRFEYTAQNIETGDESESASQHDLELGYTMGKVRLAVENSSASEFYVDKYSTAHKWMGFADLLRRQNLNQTAVHVGYKANAKLNAKLSYHMFSAVEKTSTRQEWSILGGQDTNEEAIGNEIDLTVNYKLGKNLGLQAVYATFAPGDRYTDTDALTFSYLQLTSKF